MPRTAAAVSEELTGSIHELVDLDTAPSVKGRLAAVSRRLGLPFGRVRQYWYGEITCPPAHEADLIRAYYKAAQELVEARAEHEKRMEDFARNHPALAWAIPSPLERSEPKVPDGTLVAFTPSQKPDRRGAAQRVSRRRCAG